MSSGVLTTQSYTLVVMVPGLQEVRVLTKDSRRLHPAEFHRYRQGEKDDGMNRYCGYLQLTFSQPIQVPLRLGYASHFGMGVFKAVSA
jgi:hypothetical protein